MELMVVQRVIIVQGYPQAETLEVSNLFFGVLVKEHEGSLEGNQAIYVQFVEIL